MLWSSVELFQFLIEQGGNCSHLTLSVGVILLGNERPVTAGGLRPYSGRAL